MTLTAMVIATLGVAGVLVGSFLNVVIHRVPLGKSVVRPRSSCPTCGHTLSARDNVPIVSWIVLKGRCRQCGERIGTRYPLVEIVTGLLWAGLAWWALVVDGALPLLPLVLVLGSVGVSLAVIDLDHHRLPDQLVLPLYPVVLFGLAFASVVSGEWPVWSTLGGGLLWLVGVGLPWLVTGGRGMGFGDVKIAPVLGMVLGWWAFSAAATGLLFSFLLGAVVGVAVLVSGRGDRKSAVPFGPFLLVGALLGLVIGPIVGNAYVEIFQL